MAKNTQADRKGKNAKTNKGGQAQPRKAEPDEEL